MRSCREFCGRVPFGLGGWKVDFFCQSGHPGQSCGQQSSLVRNMCVWRASNAQSTAVDIYARVCLPAQIDVPTGAVQPGAPPVVGVIERDAAIAVLADRADCQTRRRTLSALLPSNRVVDRSSGAHVECMSCQRRLIE